MGGAANEERGSTQSDVGTEKSRPTLARFSRARGGLDEPTDSEQAVVPQPIYTFVNAPKVTDDSHAALARWLDARVEYEEIMRSRCRWGVDGQRSQLCEARWDVDKKDLSDAFLWNWITTTVGSFKNRKLPDIKKQFKKELVMPIDKDDVESRVTEYFLRCNVVIRTNGLVELFNGVLGAEKKCKVLVNNLPSERHKRVKNEVDFLVPAAKTKVSVLYKVICDKALELDAEDRAVRNTKRRPMPNQNHWPPPTRTNGRPQPNEQRRREQSATVVASRTPRKVQHSRTTSGCLGRLVAGTVVTTTKWINVQRQRLHKRKKP
ncbi:TPA: hypothetical protein N0F65_002836 [Lagenidium giganteum]|uniref:Uncharacterized protein n=1 Tax=Lagenidium giganteum TaxID=4803 RepID=A0AAV2Z908_9STRA|nr:TPA: hypothetical protein N0F65_002836 [Lagenidium giganteum]